MVFTFGLTKFINFAFATTTTTTTTTITNITVIAGTPITIDISKWVAYQILIKNDNVLQ